LVTRVEPAAFSEFTGLVKNVTKESNKVGDMTEATEQYHIEIEALDKEIKGKTGHIHEWIRLSKTAKQDTIPTGSVVDRFLQQLEIVFPEVKNSKTLDEAFNVLKDKKLKFKKMKLGKAFEGHDAREYWIPVSVA
jgi:hypothetical protein